MSLNCNKGGLGWTLGKTSCLSGWVKHWNKLEVLESPLLEICKSRLDRPRSGMIYTSGPQCGAYGHHGACRAISVHPPSDRGWPCPRACGRCQPRAHGWPLPRGRSTCQYQPQAHGRPLHRDRGACRCWWPGQPLPGVVAHAGAGPGRAAHAWPRPQARGLRAAPPPYT